MSANRKRPQTQNTDKILNASEIQTKPVVKDELRGRSDEVETGGAGSASSFEALVSNLVSKLQETRTQIGLLPADAPAHPHVLEYTAWGKDHGCRICCAGFRLNIASQTPKTILNPK